ncbi:hypothetical protein G5714_006306 [Onychostoma macrolepis]|uniref:Uncharacterized protein n=1 Tax=Onychostoma macrolepis TaxID=369639 RepID=A0A7J6D3I5_9TELE|nr:hypothetical protein G5714_006306 [Onychostoma macrolepis]
MLFLPSSTVPHGLPSNAVEDVKTIEARTVRCYPQKLHQDRCWTGEHFRPVIRGLANMKKTAHRFHLRAGTVK